MGNSRRVWLLGLGIFLLSCAGIEDWHRYEKYQADGDFSRQKYEEKLLEERVKKRTEREEDFYEREVKERIVSLLREPPAPLKVPDTILRVLILPYVGEGGTLNSARYVFLKVEEGRWILGDYLIEERKGIRLLTPLKGEKDEGK